MSGVVTHRRGVAQGGESQSGFQHANAILAARDRRRRVGAYAGCVLCVWGGYGVRWMCAVGVFCTGPCAVCVTVVEYQTVHTRRAVYTPPPQPHTQHTARCRQCARCATGKPNAAALAQSPERISGLITQCSAASL